MGLLPSFFTVQVAYRAAAGAVLPGAARDRGRDLGRAGLDLPPAFRPEPQHLRRLRRAGDRHLPPAGADHDPRLARSRHPAGADQRLHQGRPAQRIATSRALRGSKSSAWTRSARSWPISSSPSPGPTCPTAPSRRPSSASMRWSRRSFPTPPTRTILDTTTNQRDYRRHLPVPAGAPQQLRALHPARSGHRPRRRPLPSAADPHAAAGRAVDRFRHADQSQQFQRLQRHAAADIASWAVASIRAPARRSRRSPRFRPSCRWGWSRRSIASSRRRSRVPPPPTPPARRRRRPRPSPAPANPAAPSPANGEVDGIKFARPLLAGLPVLVRGAGRQNSGLYYVQSVTHRISRDDYTQSFSAWRNAVGLTGAEVFIDPLAAVA